MKVNAIMPRGYCYGVINAISLAKQARKDYPNEKIYILGMIVHNKYIVEALKLLNIETLEDKSKSKLDLLDEIDEGVVILSAHGSAKEIKEKAIKRNLIVYDATCKDVTKTHVLIKEYLNQGYDVLYYGKKDHPEANAALSISDKIHLITNEDDLNNLLIDNNKILLTNQTTLSIVDAKKIFDLARTIYPNIVLTEEICNATRVRQEAVLKIENSDIVFVVGDPTSNNSNKLASIARKNNNDVYMIESVKDIDIEWLKNKKEAAITSGASTPTYLTNMVIEYLKQFNYDDKNTYKKPDIEIERILE
ncbi:4-hydroxy-3-methylbut-2-enyl diphosphate reductase [Bacilli bacterium PM5-3]|nr:4-hydroxy-3-methylbut-2-enyl diphosphate reductase [Bacilli bacterium PM5-3]